MVEVGQPLWFCTSLHGTFCLSNDIQEERRWRTERTTSAKDGEKIGPAKLPTPEEKKEKAEIVCPHGPKRGV